MLPLRGASSYTPYDAVAMLWARDGDEREMLWTSSGGESGRLLVSKASSRNRPDWVLCTQGVVAGLVSRGEDVTIISTVYISADAILPVFRSEIENLRGTRSLYISRSSIEFAFDRLLDREGVSREDVDVPAVETVGFSTIANLLKKPSSDAGALDFAVLVDPFITNIIEEQPEGFRVGEGGLYNMHYSIVVRSEDLKNNRGRFVELIRQLVIASEQLESLVGLREFYEDVWGRTNAQGVPELLPEMITYKMEPARLTLEVESLRDSLSEEIDYLMEKYPGELKSPDNIEAIVDPSLLLEVAPERVFP